ncbi:NAD(P)/FAD-dependent oxidoreductase [Nocardioides sp.]|uniref:NAD(P)/FAD-dependent oxidoreductase n=1 Tax=Nocardioides sp. TaxID=35761 RepID=UPI003D0993F2
MSTPSGSLWEGQVSRLSRPPLPGERDVDVAIVGGGFTGLWTAYYLASTTDLSVMVIEGEHVGFGASGRNGGWCSALFPASLASLAALPGSSRESALAQHQAMCDTVLEVGRIAELEGIDCGYARGGTISLARSAAQLRRARAEVADTREWGRDDVTLLTANQARERVGASRVLAATYTQDCAAIHPAKLVHGLAAACERHGVTIHENTRALSIEPGRVATTRGSVRAAHVVRATEGYTHTLRGQTRDVAPVYSLMIGTEPLSESLWEQIGLRQRETFSDHRHLIIYGQRTADDRLVFGGRGAPYHFGSRTKPSFDRDDRVFAKLRATLVDLFPALAPTRITHAWGGALGIPRDWCASVGLDRASGVGWAGGYVGDGVSTTNLAGRTLRDLIVQEETALTGLPWVNHRSPRWEPEPLRWLGMNAGLQAMTLADTEEQVTGRPSLIARAVEPLLS